MLLLSGCTPVRGQICHSCVLLPLYPSYPFLIKFVQVRTDDRNELYPLQQGEFFSFSFGKYPPVKLQPAELIVMKELSGRYICKCIFHSNWIEFSEYVSSACVCNGSKV